MRFRKVLLISPPSSSRYGGLRVPAGIGCVAQALHDSGIEHEYIDMRIGYSYQYLRKKALWFKPDLIGVSMITLGYRHTYGMLSALRELLPGTKIAAGGHHVTILKEKVLEECGSIDFGVVSDGEKTMVELCRDKLPYESVKGLVYRHGGSIRYAGDRPLVENLDEYAFARYAKFNLKNYSRQIPVHSSRGCIYKCTFCPNKLIGGKFRTKSAKYFVDEIEYWYGKGYLQFAIDDDNFTFDKKRAYAICDEIERRRLKGLFIRCSNGIRADRVDRELLSRMKEIGVREVGFGVDGGNNKVLGHLRKGETMEKIEQAVSDACSLGLDVKLFIITGTPHETKEDIEDSIRLARKFPVARVNFNNPIPYPGTEMFDYIHENKLFLVPPEKYLNDISEEKSIPVFETPELPKEERIRILRRCSRIEKEIMQNTALRMYAKYPFADFLIKRFFNVALFERLFFNNLLLRKWIEWLRYRKLIGKKQP